MQLPVLWIYYGIQTVNSFSWYEGEYIDPKLDPIVSQWTIVKGMATTPLDLHNNYESNHVKTLTRAPTGDPHRNVELCPLFFVMLYIKPRFPKQGGPSRISDNYLEGGPRGAGSTPPGPADSQASWRRNSDPIGRPPPRPLGAESAGVAYETKRAYAKTHYGALGVADWVTTICKTCMSV